MTEAAAINISPSASVGRSPAPGTQVLLRWAEWSKSLGHLRPMRIEVLSRGNFRLVLHEYVHSKVAVLKLSTEKPRIRDFREWHQPIEIVVAKLVKTGWVCTGSGRMGVSDHAH